MYNDFNFKNKEKTKKRLFKKPHIKVWKTGDLQRAIKTIV
jgi:hypothetical protein